MAPTRRRPPVLPALTPSHRHPARGPPRSRVRLVVHRLSRSLFICAVTAGRQPLSVRPKGRGRLPWRPVGGPHLHPGRTRTHQRHSRPASRALPSSCRCPEAAAGAGSCGQRSGPFGGPSLLSGAALGAVPQVRGTRDPHHTIGWPWPGGAPVPPQRLPRPLGAEPSLRPTIRALGGVAGSENCLEAAAMGGGGWLRLAAPAHAKERWAREAALLVLPRPVSRDSG